MVDVHKALLSEQIARADAMYEALGMPTSKATEVGGGAYAELWGPRWMGSPRLYDAGNPDRAGP